MKSHRLAWMACVLWLTGVAAACGNTVETNETDPPVEEPEVHPEEVCATWATDSCKALAGCCAGGALFDATDCELQHSYACSNALPPELIRAGVLEYDEEAAKKCYAPPQGCAIGEESEEQVAACRKMLTGNRPPGATCDAASQCAASAGEGYSTCYYGDFVGICVTVVGSTDQKCGFSLKDHTLRSCPEDTFCDTQDKTVPPDASPSEAAYSFEAPCKPYLGVGQPCYDANNGALFECAKGLYCDFYGVDGLEDIKCAQGKAAGVACEDSYQCAAGLECSYETGTCVEAPGLFCYAPAVCGDGSCAPQESEYNCPEDCGYCGDGVCNENEWYDCYEDCGEMSICGDGYCDLDEGDCAEDCGYCGDAWCDFDEDLENCHEDCGYCGDGYCGQGETMGECPEDCGEPCVPCGEYIAEAEGALCDGPSAELYDALVLCACEGPCMEECGDNICGNMEPTMECQLCVLDDVAGCGQEYASCANDI